MLIVYSLKEALPTAIFPVKALGKSCAILSTKIEFEENENKKSALIIVLHIYVATFLTNFL